MRWFVLWSLAGLLALTPTHAAGKIFPYDIKVDTLDNDLQVVTVPFDSPGIAAFFVLVRVGSRDEVDKGVTGFAHFFEHCMFLGTERYSKSKYNDTLQEISAGGNANTWYDRTLYYTVGNAERLETMFDMEADRFRFLKVSEQDFKAQAGAVLGEYTKNYASPFRQLFERVMETAFTTHTYGHTTMGFLADIKDMPNQYEYSLKFYDRFYRPEYTTVMVVGDVTHDQVLSLSKQYFGEWERGNYVPEIPEEPVQTEERKSHIQFPGNTNLISLSYKGPAFSDTVNDKVALDILLELGFGQRSDIYKKLVQEEQKLRFIAPDNDDTRDPYLVGVFGQVYNLDDTPSVRSEIEAVLEKFKTEPVQQGDLDALKSRIKYSLAASLDIPLNVGNILANYIWLTGDPESLNRSFALFEKVTPEDIKRVANDYFVNERRTVITLSAEEEGR